ELCRYCLMCRHTCPVTHVTRSEATSPHGWGLLVASVGRGITPWTDDVVDVLYKCADCGLCQSHCVTDQPLPLAINATRAELVDQQLAPSAVYDFQKALQTWENPYVEAKPKQAPFQGETALIVGAIGHHFQAKTVTAALKLLEAAGVETVPIALGRETPYMANTLGLLDEARTLAQNTLDEIQQVGAKRVFVLSPGEIYTYTTLLQFLGLTWPEDVELIEVTSFLADQLEAENLSFKSITLSDYTFYDPDQTVRVADRWTAPRKLLAAISDTPPTELFWRKERAAPCGVSGGLAFTQPHLSTQLAQARFTEASERGIKAIITDDPQILHHLSQEVTNHPQTIEIKSLFELLAGQLTS
ncbi:MAG: (Fe-S)-binding protein, partial [Chloroflexota bacterium]